MKRVGLLALVIATAFMSFKNHFLPDDYPTLAINSKVPAFNLLGIDGKMYTPASFSKAKILAVVFTCNHCPTAQAYEERIIKLAADYKAKGVQLIAIMPNDPTAVRLDELGWTDMSDSYAEMKVRAKQMKYNFPYLYDGKTQSVSKAFGAIATPHIFIFDQQRKLRYQGRIDDVEKPTKTPNTLDARNAIEALLANTEVPVQTTKVFGCSVKWASKSNWKVEYQEKWAKEPVDVEMIDEAGIKDLLKNTSDKLRLINVWATWCGPCVTEFPDFITINRMYAPRRDFEFVSISADEPVKKDKVLQFLKKSQASNKNYLFSVDDKYKLIEAVDPKWQGALPYTILVEPGGKIAYAKQGPIDVAEMKKRIVENKFMGRYY
ncbi:MAG: redoxin family protein [Chitinophagaceae bacterium]